MHGKVAQRCAEIRNGSQEVALSEAPACPAWVMGNAQGAGHYVTRYDADSLKRLVRSAARLPEAEAIAFVGDIALLARAGLVRMDAALDVAQAFLRHPSNGVRQGAVVLLDKLRDEWLAPAAAARKRAIVAKQAVALARSLGWREHERDRDDLRELRRELLAFAAKSASGAALRRGAREEALRWLRHRPLVAATMVRPVLGTAARFADRVTYDTLESLLAATADRHERSELLEALAQVRDPKLRERALGLALRADRGAAVIDGRDALYLLENAIGDDDNRAAAFAYIRAHYDALVAKVPEDTPVNFVERLGRGLCTREEREAFAAFFGERAQRLLGGPHAYDQALEAIDLCVAARAAGG